MHRRSRYAAAAIVAGLTWIMLSCAGLTPVYGQEPSDGYTILVMGDSLSEGLYAGLYNLVRGDKKIKLVRLGKVGTGLFNTNMDKWRLKMDKVLQMNQPQIAVVMLGGNDPQPVRYEGRRRYAFRSEEWLELYVSRLKEYMQFLVENRLTTIWVGLPVMRDQSYDEDIQYLNEIYRQEAAANGVLYLSTRELTEDEDGQYTAYGQALDGRVRQLRINDGKHFTLIGYEVLGFHVLKTIQYAVPGFEWGSAQ